MIEKFRGPPYGFYFYYFLSWHLPKCALDICFKRKQDRVKVQSSQAEEEQAEYEDMTEY